MSSQTIFEARTPLRSAGAATSAAHGCLARAPVRLRSGLLEAAMTEAVAALEAIEIECPGWAAGRSAATAWLAMCHLERDDVRAAAAVLAGCRTADAAALLAVARGHLTLACLGPAEQALDRVLEAGRALGLGAADSAQLEWRSVGALLADRCGNRGLAWALAEEQVLVTRHLRLGRPLGVALRAAGTVAGGAAGIALHRESIRVLEGSPARLDLAWSVVTLGSALHREGRRGEAREELRRGLAAAERLQAPRVTRIARDELAAAGARPRRRHATGLDSLTPSERRVAILVGRGMSNREIAAALVVTMKTVEWHLRHIYGKLDVVGRGELVARARSLEGAQTPALQGAGG